MRDIAGSQAHHLGGATTRQGQVGERRGRAIGAAATGGPTVATAPQRPSAWSAVDMNLVSGSARAYNSSRVRVMATYARAGSFSIVATSKPQIRTTSHSSPFARCTDETTTPVSALSTSAPSIQLPRNPPAIQRTGMLGPVAPVSLCNEAHADRAGGEGTSPSLAVFQTGAERAWRSGTRPGRGQAMPRLSVDPRLVGGSG